MSFPLPSVLRALVAMGDLTPEQRALVEAGREAASFFPSDKVRLVASIPELHTPDGWGVMDSLTLLGFLASVGGLAPTLAGLPAPSLVSLGEDGATVELPDGERWTVDFGGYWHTDSIHYAPNPTPPPTISDASAGCRALVEMIRAALTPDQIASVKAGSSLVGDLCGAVEWAEAMAPAVATVHPRFGCTVAIDESPTYDLIDAAIFAL